MPKAALYKVVSGEGISCFKDRGSKFYGFAFPFSNKQDLKKHLAQLKESHPKAVHFCFAYRIGNAGIDFRSSDDGEPSGSAGKPILGQIDRAALSDVLVIVLRYFGGTLLGVPGLIHAYKTAAMEAISQATIEDKWESKIFLLSFDYNFIGQVKYLLEQYQASIIHQEFALYCSMEVSVPLPQVENFCTAYLLLHGPTFTEKDGGK